jgi:ABC-type sugar transport system substrate-binding protein
MATKVFAVVAKQQEENNPFFRVVRQGCEARAAELGNVVCTVRGPEQAVASAQVAIARQFIADGVDGLAIASLDEKLTALVIEEAYAAGIPVVTFDSDVPRSKRLAYIGTNNFAFGQTLGKILWQLKPLGGQYAILSEGSPNTLERNAGVRDHLEGSPWVEVRNSPSDTEDNIIMATEQVDMFSRQAGVSAVVAVGGWPMYGPDLSVWQNIVDANRNITYVVADTLPIQIEHLSTGYVNGLVGQDPYQMGVQTMNVLLEHATNGGNGTVQTGDMFGTAFMEMVRVPLELPPANVDYHYIGNIRYMGIAFFTVIFFMSLICAHWTFSKRHVRVVMASQPQFLLMICFGVLVCASSLLTVSFDDSKVGYSGSTANGLCMSIPWLTSLGFTIMFSALFSKTRRINKIFHAPFPYERMKVSLRESFIYPWSSSSRPMWRI